MLVADDSPTVRLVVRMELEAAGYDVCEAVDGAEAVEVARRARPDVVLLDVEMPVLDGYGALAQLKADPALADIPVVVLTGLDGDETVVRALAAGAHDHLRKPPGAAELLARVGAAARVGALQEQLRARVEELDRLSRTDVLTGLHNRRHVEEQLRALGAGCLRHGYSLAVLLVDVDRFKQVNDTAGHAAGDAVLQAVAAAMAGQVRAEDVLGRWGGEEFLVLLPHTGAAAAQVLAERLRATVAAVRVPTPAGDLGVTVSIGGAAAETPGDHDLLGLADAQLYAVKGGGRDAVRVVQSRG